MLYQSASYKTYNLQTSSLKESTSSKEYICRNTFLNANNIYKYNSKCTNMYKYNLKC